MANSQDFDQYTLHVSFHIFINFPSPINKSNSTNETKAPESAQKLKKIVYNLGFYEVGCPKSCSKSIEQGQCNASNLLKIENLGFDEGLCLPSDGPARKPVDAHACIGQCGAHPCLHIACMPCEVTTFPIFSYVLCFLDAVLELFHTIIDLIQTLGHGSDLGALGPVQPFGHFGYVGLS